MTEPQTTSRRILVVANQTACGDDLLEVIEGRLRDGPCRFTLLVPATPGSFPGWRAPSGPFAFRLDVTAARPSGRGTSVRLGVA